MIRENRETLIHKEYGKVTWVVQYDAKTGELVNQNLVHHETTYTSNELDAISAFHG